MAGIFSTIFYACKKSNVSFNEDATSAASVNSASIISSGAISIASISSTTANGAKDSIYVVGCYNGKVKKDTVAQNNLSNSITTYLRSNYAGYSFKKAFKITESNNTLVGYVVVIKYNDKLIGLKFDSAGAFVKILEQREGADLVGKGWHPGGKFDCRDGKNRDTIAISALPTIVNNFFKNTYPSDTLLHAQITPDTNYILISKNNGLFATAISAKGTLIKRVTLDNSKNSHTCVLQANLLINITTYLTATYPGYVFEKAFAVQKGNVVQNYVVLITSNSTKYAVRFNAAGTFTDYVVIR
jgi:hypothetical protein